MKTTILKKLSIYAATALVVMSYSVGALYAQHQFKTGLIFDNTHYAKVSMLSTGRKLANVIPVVDLSDHAPSVGDQGIKSSCVSWAVGYAALTASRALRDNITDKGIITSTAHSALYIYNQISGGDCDRGSRVEDALEILKNQGDCFLTEFNPDACNAIPDPSTKAKAQNFKIKDYLRIFDIDSRDEDKIQAVITSIGSKHPVVIGMNVYESLRHITATDPVWKPVNNDPDDRLLGGHALAVVGYDDYTKRFKIMNSWGPDFGENGFFYISYTDFARVTQYGFEFTIADKPVAPTPNNVVVVTNNPVSLSGEFDLQKFDHRDAQTKAPIFNAVAPSYNPAGFEYSLPAVNLGDLFRLVAGNVKSDCNIYVLSVDPNKRPEVLYPFSKNAEYRVAHNLKLTDVEIPQVEPGQAVEIPGQDHAIKADVKGTHYMCILFTNNPVKDISAVASGLATATPSLFTDKLKAVLGNRLIDPATVAYDRAKMSASVTSTSGGDIVPVIVRVDVQ